MLKGFAIENEFSFKRENFNTFIELISTEPLNSYTTLLSYFGSSLISIFIFLSAYGLSKRCATIDNISYLPFLTARWKKLVPVFGLTILFWLVYEGFQYGWSGPIKLAYWKWQAILFKLTLLSNFVPHMSLQPVGPWWFIPFIFQFYLIFPLIHQLNRQRKRGIILLALGVSSILISYLLRDSSINIYTTVIGHLPEFCLGLYFAHHKEVKITPLLFVAAIALFAMGNLYQIFWHFNYVTVLVLIFVGVHHFCHLIVKLPLLHRFFTFLGNYSMYIFLTNGFLREPFIDWADRYHHWFLNILFSLISFTLVIIISVALKRCEDILLRQLKR
jgi:peptidoglycan/LPS O-acetylase OafA/YrhL